jgi:tol-pal system protein YbgF
MRRLVLALPLLVLGIPDAPALAQDRATIERLDRIERDMNMLQRQVYRGSSGGAPVPMAPMDSQTAVNTELRLDQLETQLRGLTGQIEEQNYTIDQLKRRLDQLVGDIDLRLTDIEKGKPGGADRQTPAGAQARNAPAPPPAPSAGVATPAREPGQPGVLGTMPVDRQGNVRPAPAPATAPSSTNTAALPAGTAQDQYNYAFGLLRQADYPAAEQALRAFVQRYPNDPLSANAQYWLGETYYVRKDYNNAAAAFAEGYKRYPQGGKGPDSLLKLGMSLTEIGQKQAACQSYGQLERDYPKASANILERARGERQRLECDKQR